MAKHRKTDRSQQDKSSTAREKARSSAMEAESKAATRATPADVARKHRERRFGHN